MTDWLSSFNYFSNPSSIFLFIECSFELNSTSEDNQNLPALHEIKLNISFVCCLLSLCVTECTFLAQCLGCQIITVLQMSMCACVCIYIYLSMLRCSLENSKREKLHVKCSRKLLPDSIVSWKKLRTYEKTHFYD